jgi:hypothetical protein
MLSLPHFPENGIEKCVFGFLHRASLASVLASVSDARTFASPGNRA